MHGLLADAIHGLFNPIMSRGKTGGWGWTSPGPLNLSVQHARALERECFKQGKEAVTFLKKSNQKTSAPESTVLKTPVGPE
jgi:hypothetical protein